VTEEIVGTPGVTEATFHRRVRGSAAPTRAPGDDALARFPGRLSIALAMMVLAASTAMAQPATTAGEAAEIGRALGAWIAKRAQRGSLAERRIAQSERRLWYMNPAFDCVQKHSEYGPCATPIATERDRRALTDAMAATMNAPVATRDSLLAARRIGAPDTIRRVSCGPSQRTIAIGFTILTLHDSVAEIEVTVHRGEETAAENCGSGGATFLLRVVRSEGEYRVVGERVLRYY
jgi:hypothetical protein